MTPVHTEWAPSIRIIPSRFPPVDLFETVADPADLDAVIALEIMTNPRIREEIGDLSHVPVSDRVSGPGSSYIMAPFTHLNPNGSRFSAGHFGIYYAAKDLETAIAETIHHQVKYLRETNEPAQELDMRVLQAQLSAFLIPLSPIDDARFLSPNSYADSQVLGHTLRTANSDGILYPSVRNPSGECVAIFRPCCLSGCVQAMHLAYPWDGNGIPRARVYSKSALPPPSGS